MSDDVIERLTKQGVDKIKIGGFDIDGVLRGKYVSIDKLRSALAGGFGFCDVVFGWDCTDALYDNAKVTGWHTGYPDTLGVLDPSTLRAIPWEPGVAAILCDFRGADGAPHPACPRSLLKRVLARLASHGYTAKVGCELEFWVFRETPETLHEKGYRALTPLSRGMFGYSWLREAQNGKLMRAILEQMAAFDIEIEGLHTETGPGVLEVAIRYDEALRAADKAALFKTAMKQLAHEHGLSVTFMAKWNDALPGSSGHVHLSLWKDGINVFAGEGAEPNEMLRRFAAGQIALMPELTACYAPTVNSYKRYVPGVWAPITPSWAVENRTCAIRVIAPGDPKAARIEYRQPGADLNPYIAIAASLAAGLYGIERGLVPPEPSTGDASHVGARLPRTLADATRLLEASAIGRELLGDGFVDHYARTRDWEARQYDRAVTSWELQRYFEVV